MNMPTKKVECLDLKRGVYTSHSIKDFFIWLCDKDQARGSILKKSELAEILGVHPSYLSRFFNGEAILNEDQVYRVISFLRLSEEEEFFLGLLLSRDRSADPDRIKKLSTKIDKERACRTATKTKLKTSQLDSDSSSYYLNPFLMILHMSLAVDSSSSLGREIGNKLGYSHDEVEGLLVELINLGVILNDKGVYHLIKHNLHLPEDSPLYRAHQLILRDLVGTRLSRRRKDDYGLSISFTADEVTVSQIKAKFIDFLGTVDELIERAPSRGIYHLDFNLFDWTAK